LASRASATGARILNRFIYDHLTYPVRNFRGRDLKSLLRNGVADGVLIGAAVLLSFGVVAHIALAPRDASAPLAVVFAPGTSAASATALSADAGARILRLGPSGNIVVVVANDEGFAARAYERGALLVADASTVAGCEEPAK
jgi:hypothetical protein